MRTTVAWLAGVTALVFVCRAAPASAQAADAPDIAAFTEPQRHLPARELRVPLALDRQTVDDLRALDEMAYVALGGIGFAGEVSQGEIVTRRLVRRPRAALALAWLVVHGRPAARVYAYWALRYVDPPVARAHRTRVGGDPTPVASMAGCIGSTSTVAQRVRAADERAF